MPIEQTNPLGAQKILEEDDNAIYLDVRSIPEFEAEHPAGSINIPVLHKGPAGMEPNSDFVKVVQAHLPKDKTLVVGCLRGGRSQKACEILEAEGYTKLFNVHGGFGGAMDPMTGQISQAGWKDSGLPVSQESGEGVSYESLKSSKNPNL